MAIETILLKKPHEISFSGNPIAFSFGLTPYGSAERSQDIKLQIRIQIEQSFGSNIFSEVRSELYAPDNNGRIEIDIRTIINPYLEYYTPRPSLARPVQCFNQRKRYRIAYLLLQAGQPVGSSVFTDTYYSIKGGMSYDQWHPSEFFTELVEGEKKSLHFFAPGEKVFTNELRWLYWTYAYPDNGVQSVVFKILDDAGDIITHTLPSTLFVSKWAICCAPIGYDQLNLQSHLSAGRIPVSYTVQINVADAPVIGPVEFKIDHRNFYNTHQLVYRNSAGGLETISLRGQVDFEADYTRQKAQRIVPPSYFQNLILLPQFIQQENEEQEKFKGDTGFLSLSAVEKTRDIFLSSQILEYAGNKLLPAIVINNNVKFFANRDNLISVLIEWQRAYVNDFFTPKNLMPTARSCPAVQSFSAKQLTKNLLQIMYALQSPYDQVEVEVVIAANTYTFKYTGNYGSIRQSFINPLAPEDDPLEITVRARTICDPDSDPVDTGSWTTVTFDITANSLPVANNDTYNINSGYDTPVTLSGSALANDYDPDGDAIEAIVQTSQPSHEGGVFSINAAGAVTYTPPSSVFTGQDYFDYEIREVGGTPTVTARVYINVGSGISSVYAKIVLRNVFSEGNDENGRQYGEVWIDFFSNAAGTTIVDITSLSLTINHRKVTDTTVNGAPSGTDTENTAVTGSGTKMKIFEGDLYNVHPIAVDTFEAVYLTFTVQPGTGYSVI